MQTSTLRSQFHPLGSTNSTSNSQTLIIPFKTQFPKPLKNHRKIVQPPKSSNSHKTREIELKKPSENEEEDCRKEYDYMRMMVIGGGTSIGLIMLFLIMEDQKALALGPEGPLMEEFWDNVRRYALYALTVSTGALYTIFVPIFELLKNPVSAVLIILIFGGSFFIMSQVLSAMVGVSDFSYEYAN